MNNILETMGGFLSSLAGNLMYFVYGLVILLVGYIIARVVRGVSHKGVSFLWDKGIGALNSRKLVSKEIAEVLGNVFRALPKLAFFAIMLITVSMVAQHFGLTSIVAGVGVIISFIPKAIVAGLILLLAVLTGDYVSKNFGFIGTIARYAILAFGAVLAVNQLGIDVSFLTDNVNTIVQALAWGVAGAFAIGAGVASQDTFKSIIEGAYANKGKIIESIKNSVK